MSLPENGSEGLNGGGAGGDAQVDPPQDGGGDGPNNGAADLLNRSKERASRASSAAASRDFDAGSVSSTSSFEGTDLSRVRAALGEVGGPAFGKAACLSEDFFAASVHDYFLRDFRCVFEACALRNLKICARTPQVFNQGVVVRYLDMSPMTSGTILVYRMWLL